jgi:DNA mismatch endonuclease (patch repair protein)
MVDHLKPEDRSANMAAIRSKDTVPELVLRRLIHGMGFRYRLHIHGLPGKPDLVFPGRAAVIFMHGCFWHRHVGCRFSTMPSSNIVFWTHKFRVNMERDRRTKRELQKLGYRVLIVWQCELKQPEKLSKRVSRFLEADARRK